MKNIRVRFAPSPTGPLHIGGVRTALYNYLLTKKYGGTFVLRIEDTDRTRYVPSAEQYIIKALKWFGIVPDEGPGFGGEYGPYRQSDRKEVYQKYAQQLIDSGHAYYAFDTAEELDAKRESNPISFKYDNQTRLEMNNSLTLSEEEVQKRLESDIPYTIRLKMPKDETIVVQDLIRGEVSFDTNELDDKILMKGDGMPTYHLAVIVDDHLMKITHIIRGEEWLPSTAHHILMYRFFGWEAETPAIAHLPLILKPSPESYLNKTTVQPLSQRLAEEFLRKFPEVSSDFHSQVEPSIRQILQDKKNISRALKEGKKDVEGKKLLKLFLRDSLFGKLGKRDGDRLGFPVFPMAWEDTASQTKSRGYQEAGFLPEAVNNFLALLSWNPGTEQEVFSIDELAEAFTINNVSKAGARFNYDKAKWFNQQYIMAMSDATLAARIRPNIEAQGYQPSDAFLQNFCGLMKERAVFLNDFWESGYYFFEPVKAYDEKTIQKRWKPERQEKFEELYSLLEALTPFETKGIETQVKEFINESGLKFGDVLPILRIALSGTMKGPGVFEMMELIGKEEILKRLKLGYERFNEIIATINI